MSEFYKRKRNLIIKNYKYLGMKEKVSFYFYRFFMIFTISVLLFYLFQLVKLEKSEEGVWAILILGAFTLLCYFFSISNSKKQQKDKINAVFRFVKEPDINIEIVDALIGEIERYNKKMRTFATWIAGLSATFIILLANLVTNSFMKIFDIYLKVIPMDEISKILEIMNQSSYINDSIFSYLKIGFSLLFIFIMMILIIYNVFTIFTFIKEQILIFLFDVRYELLSGGNQESKSKGDDNANT